ncbi:MAG: hypothetical protein H6828_14905 [Planctomycetes bacterium]|nr:hypothetical protein [Planctomycetota bacterium]
MKFNYLLAAFVATSAFTVAAAQGSDDCSTATAIAGQGAFAWDTTLATAGVEGQAEANCLFFGSSAMNKDVWFSWTADATGTATVSLCGNTLDSKLASYPGGGCPANGTSIVCNDDSCGLQSEISFAVNNGTSYMVQIGAFSATGTGTGTMNVSILGPQPPANDDCTNAAAIAGDGLFAFDTNLATVGAEGQTEAICLFFGQSGIDSDVWYSWTAPASGTAVISTCGLTGVDTKLAAYPGGGCPTAGSSLVCNDDTCGLQSELSLAVTAGSSYMIQVGTFPGAAQGTGSLAIKTFTGDNDHCSTPVAIAGQGSFAYDATNATTGLEGQAEAACFFFGSSNVHKDLWFSWTADVTGDATVSTCAGATFDTKIAAYAGSGCPAAPALACNDDSCGLQSSMTFPVVAGTTYTLQIGTFSAATTAGPASFDVAIAPTEPGSGFCFCDGTGAAAPCLAGTGAAGNGCANSANAAGAHLTASGTATVGSDTVVLSGSGLPTGQPGLYFQGENAINGGLGVVFGDGLRCAGQNVIRLGVRVTDGTGASDTTGITVSVKGGVTVGDLRHYQLWYRDPNGGAGGPCGNVFNLSNGYTIQW